MSFALDVHELKQKLMKDIGDFRNKYPDSILKIEHWEESVRNGYRRLYTIDSLSVSANPSQFEES
jgi:hypothetical protein